MPDDIPPGAVEKRLHYFDGQFLQDTDFTDEQLYQLDREHRHNRLLHGAGIAEGLTVTSAAPNEVTVAPGTAIDSDGHQIVLAEATDVELLDPTFTDKEGIELYVSYRQKLSDEQEDIGGGGHGFTRWHEDPELTAVPPGGSYQGEYPPVPLARLTLDETGNVITVDASVRPYSGLLLPGAEPDPARLRATPGGPADLTGSLTVDGVLMVGTGTAQPSGRLHVNLPKSPDAVRALQIDVESFVTQGNAAASYFLLARDAGAAAGTGDFFAVRGDGNVGVGTAKPAARLHVAGQGGLTVDLLVSGRLRSNNNDGGLWVAEDRLVGGFDTSKLGLYNGRDWRLVVLPDGNVGVGTVSPAARLHVHGSGGGNVDLLVNGQLRSDNNDGGLWVASDRFVGGNKTNQIGFYNDKEWRLVVLPNGNVGIGTDSPENEEGWRRVVDVLGDTSTKLSVRTGNVDGRIQSHDGRYWGAPSGLLVGTRSKHALSFGTEGKTRMTIATVGRVGLGTTEPGANLHVWVPKQATYIHAMTIDVESFVNPDNQKNSYFLLARDVVAGRVAWSVRGDGHAGVGTADPQADLHVAGEELVDRSLFVEGDIYRHWITDTASGWRRVEGTGLRDVPNDTAVPYASDSRLKTRVRPVSDALATLGNLRGVRYRWSAAGLNYLTRDVASSVSAGPGATDEQNHEAGQAERRRVREALGGDRMGLVAQEVEAVAPELVVTDADGYKHIRYHHLTALLVEAVKEQDERVRSLSASVAALQRGRSPGAARQPEGE
jgi:hypothetical protein